MRLGIDIDDTITETKQIFKKYIKRFVKKNHLDYYQELKILHEYDFKKFINQNSSEIYQKMKLKKNVKKILIKLKKEGHQLFFITARSNSDVPNVEEITLNYFKNNNIPFDKIIFKAKDKSEAVKNLKIELFVDDREDFIDKIKEEILCLRFVPQKNVYSKYQKVTSWIEIYKIIEKEQ